MKIGITGSMGRMGQEVLKQLADSEHTIAGIIEKADSPLIGSSVELGKGINFTVKDDSLALFEQAEVVIDFSTASASVQYAQMAAQKHKALVIGTTGFSEAQIKILETCAEKTPLLRASNLSLGVNILLSLVEKTAQILSDFDIEILEIHHNQKADAPSGTALSLGEAAARGRNQALKNVITPVDRNGVRSKGSIGFAVLRGGDVAGEHDVIFAGQDERLILSHKASSRTIFAKGAIKAAEWLYDKPAGLYNMRDVLGLN